MMVLWNAAVSMGELAKDTRSMATVWCSHVTFELQTGLEFRNTVGFSHPLSRMGCNRIHMLVS